MNNYILFLYGSFDDHTDVEFFCSDIFTNICGEGNLKYVIETKGGLVILFDYDGDKSTLSKKMDSELKNIDIIRFYFTFEKKSLISSTLPENMAEVIFKPNEVKEIKPSSWSERNDTVHDLDSILEKIEIYGVESLTTSEKKFLDDFEK